MSDVIPPSDIGVSFDDIGALENVKETLKELVMLPLQRPELFGKGQLTKVPFDCRPYSHMFVTLTPTLLEPNIYFMFNAAYERYTVVWTSWYWEDDAGKGSSN